MLRERLHVSADLMKTYSLEKRVSEYKNKLGGSVEVLKREEPWFFGDESKGPKKINEQYLEIIRKHYPHEIETLDSVRKRVALVKESIRQFMRANPDKRVAVISHSSFLKIFTAPDSYWAEHGYSEKCPKPPNCLILKNCELAAYDLI